MLFKKTKAADDRKPVAVLGAGKQLAYLQGKDGRIYEITNGYVRISSAQSLEELLHHPDREGVYKGEAIEVTFV